MAAVKQLSNGRWVPCHSVTGKRIKGSSSKKTRRAAKREAVREIDAIDSVSEVETFDG
jgi:hypothetical protein